VRPRQHVSYSFFERLHIDTARTLCIVGT
jgi:hypothetical protein